MSETTTAAPVKKWTSTAGPIQTKRVDQALRDLRTEGQSYTEKNGVIGVSESSFDYFSPFGGMRDDARCAIEIICQHFDWKVTRENFTEIIAEAGKHLEALKRNRPVVDKRISPEDAAQKQSEREAAAAQREAEEAEKAHRVNAKADELRLLYPWARGVRNGKSEHAGTAACLKYELEHAYPGVPFSVTSDYNSISCRWELGPKTEDVNKFSRKYQNSSFDGMTDSTNYDHSVEGEAVTQVLGRVRFVSVSRQWPEGLIDEIAKLICAAVGVPFERQKYGILDLPQTNGHGGVNSTAEDHAYQLLNRTTFAAGESVKGVELAKWVDGESDNDTWHWLKIVMHVRAAVPTATPAETTGTGVQVRRNYQHNGVEVELPLKPERNTINLLKASGFRWSQHQGVWYKKFSPVTWEAAHRILGLEVPELPAEKPKDAVDAFDMAVEDRMAEQCGLTGTHD